MVQQSSKIWYCNRCVCVSLSSPKRCATSDPPCSHLAHLRTWLDSSPHPPTVSCLCRHTLLTWWLTAARCAAAARRAAPQTGSPVTAATAGFTSAATSARAWGRLTTMPTQTSRAATRVPTVHEAQCGWRRKQLVGGRRQQQRQQPHSSSRNLSLWRLEGGVVWCAGCEMGSL
jgi:hypothetical protein